MHHLTPKAQKEELEWIYHTLVNKPGVYLLEGVVDACKEYCVDDVHGWAKLQAGVYGKIRDLIKVRIHEAVQADKLDKTLAAEILKTYYYARDRDAGREVVGGIVLSDADRRLLERAGILYDPA